MKHTLDSMNMLTMVSNKSQNKCLESANNYHTSAMNDMVSNFNKNRKGLYAKPWKKCDPLKCSIIKIRSAYVNV